MSAHLPQLLCRELQNLGALAPDFLFSHKAQGHGLGTGLGVPRDQEESSLSVWLIRLTLS